MNAITTIIVGLLVCNNWLLASVSSFSLKKPVSKKAFLPLRLAGAAAALVLATTMTTTTSPLPAAADTLTKVDLQQALRENNKILEQKIENKLGFYPLFTAGIAVLATTYSANRLDDTLKRFEDSKTQFKDDLETKSRNKAFLGTIVGALVVIILMMPKA